MKIDDCYYEAYCWFWFSNIKGIGLRKRKHILEYFYDAKAVYEADSEKLSNVSGISPTDVKNIIDARKDLNIYERFYDLIKQKIKYTYPGADNYPKRLKELYDYPSFLYCRGRMPDDDSVSVGIVGARNCSEYGKRVAYKFAYDLAKSGINIISGMANGIDSYAHRGALAAGGYTAAVLGCGVDVCYPLDNVELYMDIIRYGGVISEYPLKTAPFPGQFPVRNRIISGLSDIIIVVEAKRKSGSLITVDQALEQNKEVFVVPGRLGDVLSEGCNDLIKQGASVITDVSDVFEYINKSGIFIPESNERLDKNDEKISDEKINLLASSKDIVYSCFDLCSKDLDSLIEETGLDISVLSEILLELQLEGWIEECSKNCYIKSITK